MPKESPDKPTESPKKPKDDRARVEIHPSIVAKISELLPEHQSDRPLSFVVNDLLAEQLKTRVDREITLKRPPGSYSYSSSSNSLEELQRGTFLTPVSENFVCHDPEDHEAFLKEQKKLAQKDSPAFQIFWEVYQASPSKAHNQSKSKARTAWKEALKTEKAENLIEAAKRAVKDQASKIGQEIWCAPFPDAHRWLKDECFTLWLEDITPKQAEKVIPGVTIL